MHATECKFCSSCVVSRSAEQKANALDHMNKGRVRVLTNHGIVVKRGRVKEKGRGVWRVGSMEGSEESKDD